MAGNLVSPVYVCLQEQTRKFRPGVKRSLYLVSNIQVTCSKSGKLTKTDIRYWTEHVLYPSVSEGCLLMFDSWCSQTDPTIYNEVFIEDITCETMQIPPKTTHDIQPLDRCFF